MYVQLHALKGLIQSFLLGLYVNYHYINLENE